MPDQTNQSGPPEPWPGRAILHVDMDAFYVSVELLRHPELRGKPVVVGASGSRGVVAAASYEARKFGVRSALPSTKARRLCPNLVFLSGDHDHYSAVSAQVHAVFHTVTPLVEPLSLDEAFLDVTGSQRLLGQPSDMARLIRSRIADQLGLPCSVGVASNKFVAKVASVAAKPQIQNGHIVAGRGVLEIRPGQETAFLHPLPVRALWGVGPAMYERLQRVGIERVADLAALDLSTLQGLVGAGSAAHLHRLANGIDDREVEVERAQKSIGHEETYGTDRYDHTELRREIVRLSDGVASRLRAQGLAARTLTLKVRYSDFETITRSLTSREAVDSAHAIVQLVTPLLDGIEASRGIRLLGVSATKFETPIRQMRLGFDETSAVAKADTEAIDWQQAESVVDAIRRKFGAISIGMASAVDERGLRVVRKGAQQWGPDQAAPGANEDPSQ